MDCLVDIDKLIDDLESEKPAENNANNRGVADVQQSQRNEFIPVSSVFSSLNDYVNAKDTEKVSNVDPKEQSSTSKITIRKFSNPNYQYDDNYTSSDDEIDADMAQHLTEQSNNQPYYDSSTTSSSVSTSSPDSNNVERDDAMDKEKLLATDTMSNNESAAVVIENVPKITPFTSGSCPTQDQMSLSKTYSNDVVNLEGMSSISSMVEITSNYKKLKSDCKDNSGTMNEKLEKEVASITSDFFVEGLGDEEKESMQELPNKFDQDNNKKSVGFESTMDDVSDTELESYLQELEDEMQASSPKEVPEEDGDNLSKASTIEFNDLKSKEVEAVEEKLPNEKLEVPEPESSIKPHIEPNMFRSVDSIRFADSLTTDQNHTKSDNTFQLVEDSKSIEEPIFEEVDIPNEPNKIENDQKESVLSDAKATSENISKQEDVVDDSVENPEVPMDASIENSSISAEPKIPRPNSLDIQTTNEVSEPVVEPAPSSPGNTPNANNYEIQHQENDGMTSSSSEDFPTALSSNVSSGVSVAGDITITQLGRIAPNWVPDNEYNNCMQCDQKFSLIKRRHHCRACGQLLCSSCCCMKAKLEYMGDTEARICIQCDNILSRRYADSTNSPTMFMNDASRQPNPNNPMEYCSTLPPHQQVGQGSSTPISVMVPVGVLKRDGQPRSGRKDKNVIFSDGIRPGCDLTELDNNWDAKSGETYSGRRSKNRVQTPPGTNQKQYKFNVKLPAIDEENKSYIPRKENELPPIYTQTKTEYKFTDVTNDAALITRLHNETLKFAIQRNFYVMLKIVKLTCCVNKTVINFTTKGLHHVGQDEIIILLELDETNTIPKDIFLHLNDIYNEADKGNTITELGYSMPKSQNFLGSKEHGGFLFIRATFQCLQNIVVPECPYLIGVLIHRWEVPWAKIFPLRLMLRLGALYRYYPTPHFSVRNRDSVYAEIAQTIINFLADFRTYSYTIPTVREMVIHMEDRKTIVLIPRNRYDQVVKAVNNSSDHILALAGNFSKKADGHLVCIQNTEANSPEQLHSYSTQAINIQGQPRKVTGASFIILNGALKTSSGLSGKCNIVEDGLMVQILPTKMVAVREALKNMKDIEIVCGPVDADAAQTEIVSFQWNDNDLNFNIGVFSPIDKKEMSGIASIRCHNSLLYSNANHSIRWTEVFIIKSDDDSSHGRDPVNVPRLSEQIARSTCQALVSFLDLLAANDLVRIGLRITLGPDPENVCYEAGSQYSKLAPLYMDALDNELIGTLHRQASNLHIDTPIILELIFCILDK